MITLALAASGLSKHFGGVTALDTVDITLHAGEVHGVVGENGAGKSTLVKILSGVLQPDRGSIRVAGQPISFTTALDAVSRGVAIVAQDLTVFPDLTVAENLFPHAPPRRGGLLSPRRMAERAAPVLEELGLRVPAGTRAGSLSLADQQLVEIGRALLQQPRVLILDEPTSALPGEAVERLMSVLRKLVDRGIAVLYVSHFLEEVLRIAHRVTVLRDGHAVVAGVSANSVNLDSLVTAMLGQAAAPGSARTHVERKGAPAITFDGVSVRDGIDDVSFSISPGEIVGFAGLQGAGHLTALAVLSGRAKVAKGRAQPAPRSPRHAVCAGIAFVSSDRKRYGLMADKSVWQNISAACWLGIGRGGTWLRRRRLTDAAAHHMWRLRIRGEPDDITATLSGGNQQKVVVAKWLDIDPWMIILDDPTRGVDVGARAEMHAVISELADDDKPVLLASTDLLELVDLCDRVLVFRRGQLVDEITRPRLSEQALSVAMNAGFIPLE